MGLKIGSLLGTIARAIPGPIGAVANVLTRAPRPGLPASPAAGNMPVLQSFGPGGQVTGPVFRGPSFGIGPGGVQFTGPSYTGPTGQLSLGGGGDMAPKGYHRNKALTAVDGQHGRVTPSKQRRASQVVQEWVKNRHLNPLNPRALSRASSRAHSFIKFSKHIVGYYQAKKPKGRPFIKRRKS